MRSWTCITKRFTHTRGQILNDLHMQQCKVKVLFVGSSNLKPNMQFAFYTYVVNCDVSLTSMKLGSVTMIYYVFLFCLYMLADILLMYFDCCFVRGY